MTSPHDPSNSAVPQQRLRRRAIVSVVWAVTLGTVTTIAIAWMLAVAVDTIQHPGNMTYRRTPGVAWTVQEYMWHGAESAIWIPLDSASPNELSPQEFDARSDDSIFGTNMPLSSAGPRVFYSSAMVFDANDAYTVVIEHARGWPLLALGCGIRADQNPGAFMADTPLPRVEFAWGVEFKSFDDRNWDLDLTHLPLKPLFPGFYLDTALYGSLWWAALFWRPLRRRRRIARGQCPACAYSLAGLPPGTTKCPECGAPSPALALAAA